MAGDNKCKVCGQWAGKSHACPAPSATAVLDRPEAVISPPGAAEVSRSEVADRVASVQERLTQSKMREEMIVCRDVQAMADAGEVYYLDPEEGSLGWEEYADKWAQDWDDERLTALTKGTGYEENPQVESLLRNDLTKARNRVQGFMYEQYGVVIDDPEASEIAWDTLEEVGVDRLMAESGNELAGQPEFVNRMLTLADKEVPVSASVANPYGPKLPEPTRPLAATSRADLDDLRDRALDAARSGVPGDFTNEEIATLRADMLPTPREYGLRMHKANSDMRAASKKADEAADDSERRAAHLRAFEVREQMSEDWRGFSGTAQGRALAEELDGGAAHRGTGLALSAMERDAARRNFTRATGIAVDPSWEDGYNAAPPNLPYGNGCSCNRFQWVGVCPHVDPSMAKREYVQKKVSEAAHAYFGTSELGKAASKAGMVRAPKKEGFFKRLFG